MLRRSCHDDDFVKIPFSTVFDRAVILIVLGRDRHLATPFRIEWTRAEYDWRASNLSDGNPYLSDFFRAHEWWEVPVDETRAPTQ
jgi:hypothetical protein